MTKPMTHPRKHSANLHQCQPHLNEQRSKWATRPNNVILDSHCLTRADEKVLSRWIGQRAFGIRKVSNHPWVIFIQKFIDIATQFTKCCLLLVAANKTASVNVIWNRYTQWKQIKPWRTGRRWKHMIHQCHRMMDWLVVCLKAWHQIPTAQTFDTGYSTSIIHKAVRTFRHMSERAFSRVGPATWNALPDHIRTVADPVKFRKLLKSHY